jgi:hypothetical protein
MKDAIMLFGGVFVLVGLPLFIFAIISGRRAEKSEKQA